MGYREYIKLFFVATSSAIANKCYPLFVTKGLDTITSLILSSALASVAFFIQQILLRYFIRIISIRKLTDSRAPYEGEYIEIIDGNDSAKVYSIVYICYEYCTDDYSIQGLTYTSEGVQICDWKSISPFIDILKKEISFLHDGYKQTGERVLGHTCYRFAPTLKNGSGYFVDSGSNISQRQFHLEKLTKERIVELSGHKEITDKAAFIKLYHEKVGKNIEFIRNAVL